MGYLVFCHFDLKIFLWYLVLTILLNKNETNANDGLPRICCFLIVFRVKLICSVCFIQNFLSSLPESGKLWKKTVPRPSVTKKCYKCFRSLQSVTTKVINAYNKLSKNFIFFPTYFFQKDTTVWKFLKKIRKNMSVNRVWSIDLNLTAYNFTIFSWNYSDTTPTILTNLAVKPVSWKSKHTRIIPRKKCKMLFF